MDTNALAPLFESLKLKLLHDQAYGQVDGFPLLVTQVDDSLLLNIGLHSLPQKDSGVMNFLAQAKSSALLNSFSFSDSGHLLVLELVKAQWDGALDLLKDLMGSLKSEGVSGGCLACGHPHDLKFFTLDKNFVFLCPDCAAKRKEEETNLKNPVSFVLGFLGALAGALVGSIAWIVIGALGFIASIAGMAMGFASFYGYQFLKGPATSFRLVAVAASVLISLVFAEYSGMVIQILKESDAQGWGLDLWTALAITPELLSNPEVISEMLPNFGLGLLFAALGTWGLFKNLSSAPAPVVLQPVE